MKKSFSFLFAGILLGILLLSSCAKEDPEPIDNTGSNFSGNWAVSENSKDYGVSTYNVTITDSSDASYILIAYLYGFNKKTYATVGGSSFTIPSQIIQGYSVSGSGTLTNANRIDLKYLVQTTGTHYDTVIAVLNK